MMNTASLCALGSEENQSGPVMQLLNDTTGHLATSNLGGAEVQTKHRSLGRVLMQRYSGHCGFW
jgi:hypothetical protein